jgi:diguanylate cyclase (GGDEF)-like protein/PAS domain S-box-containing protein
MSTMQPHDHPHTPTPVEADETSRKSGLALAALLHEHPEAVIYTQTADGLIVPPPDSLGVEGHRVLATEGRTGMDLCVAEDRMTMVNAWMCVKREGVAEAKGRLCSNPEQWMVVRILDLRKQHGVILNVGWPTSEGPTEQESRASGPPSSTTPRFCTRKQDEEAAVIDCDDAYVEMFGYAADEVIGQPTFERVHPEDQARVIEGWIATVATGRMQMFRIRMKRSDGSWLWVDTTLHNYLSDEQQPHVLAECIDVSAEMAAQEALQDREELLRQLIEEMPDGLLQLDGNRDVVYHNPRLLEILCGIGETRLAGDAHAQPELFSLDALLHALTPAARESFDGVVERALRDGIREDIELEAVLSFGEQRHVLMKVRPLQRSSGVITGVIASVLDVTDSARARRELEERATFDALTGVQNRASIMAALAAELEHETATGVVFVDIDHFKSINDTYGHAAGDEVLAAIASSLRGAMRASDELGRLGGDEFLILLRGAATLDVAMRAAQRLSDSVREPYELSCGSLEMCASIGVAWADGTSGSAEELVERADAAMYRSKEQRRGIPVLAA